jgi:hypothetical protein
VPQSRASSSRKSAVPGRTVVAFEERPTAVAPFRVRLLRGDEPVVVDLLARFLRKHHLPMETRPAAINWFCLERDGKIAVVFGLGMHPNGGIEGTDFYAEPSRDGVQACYEVLRFFKAIIDRGLLPYAVTSTFAKNTAMRRRFERVFGMDGPSSVVYYYKSEGYQNGRV